MSPAERRIGLHAVQLEPPDTIMITVVGDLSVEQTLEVHVVLEELSRAGSFFALADLTRLGRTPPAARAVSTRWPHMGRIRALAVFGTGFEQRVVATLIIKAMALLSKDFTAKLAFFATG